MESEWVELKTKRVEQMAKVHLSVQLRISPYHCYPFRLLLVLAKCQ